MLTVTPAPLTAVTAALTGSTTKTYDGTTTATLTPANFLLGGFVNGDSASVTKTTGDYASKNVGSNLMVSTSLAGSDFAPAGSTQLSNYSLPASASGPIGAITPAPLTVAAKDASKTFGQTLSFTGNEFSASGLRNGETIGSVALSSTGAVASASVAGGPYPIIPSNANGGTFDSGNYTVTYVNGVLTVTPATLTAVAAALTGTTTKTYDGTTTATLTPTNFLLSGFVNGDSASVTKTTGDYASKNVGSNLVVSTSLASSDFAPAGSTQLSNYSLPASASGPIGAITPAPLTVTAKDASKTFGKTLSFTGNEFSASGLRNGETIGSVALSSTGAAASASVAGGPYPIIPSNANGGTFSTGNYNVSYVNGVLTVTPAPLTAVTAALTGTATKAYDGTTAATLTPANFLLSGFVNNDSASVTKTTGDYASKNVGSNLMVSTSLASSDFAPAGSTQLSNYSLPASASGPIGAITPAPLTVAAKDASKTFGQTLSFSGSEFSASGLRNGETIGSVALSSTGAVATASVAGGPYPIIPSNANGGTFNPGNYNVTYVNGVLTVTPAPLTAVTAALTGSTTKTYDGTTTATLTPANFLLGGFVNGDSASVTKTTGTYESKDVGSNLVVSTSLASSDFAPAGSTQLSNYSLPASASGPIGTITPAPLTVTAKDASKTFGKTLSFTGNEFSASGLQNGEMIDSVSLNSTGTAANASVAGGPYPIIPSNASGGTFNPGNYSVTYLNNVLTITPAPLTAVAAALTGTTTKTYDGTPTATLTPANFLLSGFISGDSASVTKTTGDYESKNVGSNLMVSTSLASSDFAPASATQLSNYSLPASASGPIGTITPAPLAITAKDASKTFGQTLSFTGSEFSANGLRNGETIGNVALVSTGAAATASVAGSPYPIIPSNANGGTFSLSNYNVTYLNGTLVVNSTQTGTPVEPPTPVVFNEPSSPEAGMARAPTNLVVAFVEKMKAAAIETETKAEDKKKPKTDMVLEGEICRP
ncbi:MAG: hypothetical protein IPH35_13435 [Rhodoferax sp.]|nr:hypothetical protein [Rhodoferax sp.]